MAKTTPATIFNNTNNTLAPMVDIDFGGEEIREDETSAPTGPTSSSFSFSITLPAPAPRNAEVQEEKPVDTPSPTGTPATPSPTDLRMHPPQETVPLTQ